MNYKLQGSVTTRLTVLRTAGNNNNNNNVPLGFIHHWQTAMSIQSHQRPPCRAALTQLTIYRGLSRLKCSHTRRVAIDNRTGSASWTLTRWRDQHTSDKVAHYSIYRPRNDERLSWPIRLTYSGRLTHIGSHPSAIGRAWDRKSSLYHCATQPTKVSLLGHHKYLFDTERNDEYFFSYCFERLSFAWRFT